MSKYYIVWNEEKTEGVIFDDERDAIFAQSGKRSMVGHSTLAYDWRDNYDDLDGDVEIQEVEL